MPQISASIPSHIIESIKEFQKSDKQESFSQMVEILLKEAINTRSIKYIRAELVERNNGKILFKRTEKGNWLVYEENHKIKSIKPKQ